MSVLWLDYIPPPPPRAPCHHSSPVVRWTVSWAVASYLVLPLPITVFCSLVALLLLAIERSQTRGLAARRPIG